MRTKFILILAVFQLSVINIFGDDPEWLGKMKSIVLLKSNREEVRQIFGKPVEEKDSLIEYFDLPAGRVSVIYASGLCVTQTEDGITRILGWKVPKYTVIEISIFFTKRIKPEKLKADLSGFESYNVKDVPGAVIYENDETGISYTTYKGKIEEMNFYPKAELKYLDCKNSQ